MGYELTDTHCHLDFSDFDMDRDEVIDRARQANIVYMINVGSSLEGSNKSIELSKRYDFIYATVGIHPHQADSVGKDELNSLSELAGSDKVVAIGEIGLDFFKNYSKPDNQKKLFVNLIRLAKDMNLPLVIHNRLAHKETLDVLKQFQPLKAVVHCFSGNQDFLKECLDLGFYISFTCNLTYRKAENLRNLLKMVPLDRLLLETDAPFLPPEGLRGKRNEPSYVKYLAEEIARIRQIDIQRLGYITTENTRGFFGLR
ncbi:MAG: TatD family hydrolase [Candidatus Omnitrophica bacterium]|nr:TatD family hydrolase [Candidatus Omnitrophota bacterium]